MAMEKRNKMTNLERFHKLVSAEATNTIERAKQRIAKRKAMKIDQEEFNRKAQHILDTVVKPQVEKYEQAKAEGTLLPKPRQVGAAGFVADEYASKAMKDISGQPDIERAAEEFAKKHSIYPTAQDDTEYGFKCGAKWMREQKRITLSRFRRIYQDFVDEKITMSRMVELLNEQEEQDDRIL
jgi:hypothetical protein